MKNKIIGLFMLATMSTISMGGCFDKASKPNTDEKLKEDKAFTSIEVTSSKELEAVVIVKFEKETKVGEGFVKFEGSAVEAGKTQANGKDVKDPVKLADLGTAGEQELKFTVTNLKGDEKITVSLVDSQGKALKDKDGNEIKSEATVKPAAPKPTAEIVKVEVDTNDKKQFTVTIKLENGLDGNNFDKYTLTFSKDIPLPNGKKLAANRPGAISNDSSFTNQQLTIALTAYVELNKPGDIEVTLASKDPNFLVKGDGKMTNK